MIFKPRFPRRPPQGRIDWVVYSGAKIPMADVHLYAVDYDTGDVFYVSPADLVGVPVTGAAGGDLSGTYPNPSVDNVPDAALSANVPLLDAAGNSFENIVSCSRCATTGDGFSVPEGDGVTMSLADAITAGAQVIGGIIVIPA